MTNRKLTASMDINEFPYAIQCTDKISGKTGTFLYDRAKALNGEGLHAISPVFSDQVEMWNFYRDTNTKPIFCV